jgi:predicted DNA-binding transcriptional regulator AlpA
MISEDYFDANQASQFTKLSVSTLNKFRLSGDGPRYMKLGRRVVYARAALMDWMHRRERASTSDPAGRARAA